MTTQLVEAVVQVGSEETSYLRCGRGGDRCVIVITEDETERVRLTLLLGETFRTVAPVFAESSVGGCGDPAVRLQKIMDGLGIVDATLVLSARLERIAGALASTSCCTVVYRTDDDLLQALRCG